MPTAGLSDVALGSQCYVPAQQVQHHTQVDLLADKLRNHCPWAPIWVQDMPAKCCPAPCTFKARAEGLAQLKPAQAASCVWCPHGRQRTDPAVFIAVDDLNLYYGNAGTAVLALKYKTFRRKTDLPKACNFHVQMPGSLNCKQGRSMAGECLRDVALGQLAVGCEMGLTLGS